MLDAYREEMNKLILRRESALSVVARETAEVEKAEDRVDGVEESQVICQNLAKAIQEKVHAQIASIVSECLEAVFDEPYDFKIRFEQARGRTEARLTFVRGELEVDPMTAAGGGVVDLAAFALRISCIMLSQPPVRRFLAMDESFKFVSAEYRPRVKAMLEMLAERLDFQILFVTHIKELVCGEVIQLEPEGKPVSPFRVAVKEENDGA